jgi:hypothetical protein
MPVVLTIRDETSAGDVFDERPLELPSERMTVRELIRERVYQEVQDYNRRSGDKLFRGLVQPTDAERVLNGKRAEYRLKTVREIDWHEQYEKALDAFNRMVFLILIDDVQAESLDQEFNVSSRTQISFLKLTMLVGG